MYIEGYNLKLIFRDLIHITKKSWVHYKLQILKKINNILYIDENHNCGTSQFLYTNLKYEPEVFI